MKKRRHHYVWQHYLRAWTVENQIACLRDGRTFRTGTTTVAVEKDFYRLQDVTEGDLRFLEAFLLS
jgi:hypothetical protein